MLLMKPNKNLICHEYFAILCRLLSALCFLWIPGISSTAQPNPQETGKSNSRFPKCLCMQDYGIGFSIMLVENYIAPFLNGCTSTHMFLVGTTQEFNSARLTAPRKSFLPQRCPKLGMIQAEYLDRTSGAAEMLLLSGVGRHKAAGLSPQSLIWSHSWGQADKVPSWQQRGRPALGRMAVSHV